MYIIEDYKLELATLESQFNIDKTALIRKYAKMQIKYLKGDIIQDNVATIQVTGHGVYTDFGGIPKPIYKGIALTKKLVPMKNDSVHHIYGNEGIELIKRKE